jgi:ParB-like chromosome segregation protein Spo0J
MTVMKINDLNNYYKNPRKGNVELVAESLRAYGQYRSIVVNLGTKTKRPNEVLVGNHTLEAAKKIGLSMLNCKIIDVDDQTAAKIVLVDNSTSDMGTYDDNLLLELLESLEDDLAGTGFTDIDIEDLLVSTEEEEQIPVNLTQMERFANTTMKAMFVELDLPTFVEAQKKLATLMAEMELTSSAAVIAKLAAEEVAKL